MLLALSCLSVTADLCAAAAASQSSQSVTCQLCERSWAKDLPCWVEGRCPFSCLRGSCKIEQNRVRYEQSRVQYEQNRVVYKIEAQGRVYLVCS